MGEKSVAMELLDEYDDIIDRYASDFKSARKNPLELSEALDGFSREVEEWSKRWNDTSVEIKPEEAGKIKRRLNKLNRRVRDLIGSCK